MADEDKGLETAAAPDQQQAVPEVDTGTQKSELQEAEAGLRAALGIEEPKPEEKPAEQAPETVQQDQELDELKNPNRENWRKLDKIARERKAKLKELEDKVKELEAKAVQAPPATTQVQPQAEVKPPVEQVQQPQIHEPTRPLPPEGSAETKQYPPEDVIGLLARIENGEFVETIDGQAAQIKKEAIEYLSTKLTPAEVKQVLLDATKGRFGNSSETMARLAREYLPVVLTTYEETQQRLQQETAAKQARGASWNEVFNKYPDLQSQKSDSKDYKDYSEASQTIAGIFPGIWNRPDAPKVIADFMELRRQASSADTAAKEAEALRKENAELKKRLGVSERPQASNRSTIQGQQARVTPEDQLRLDLAQALGREL